MRTRTPSLSIVLPLRNAQTVLPSGIERLLEIVTQLTSELEILLVDNRSSDATAEIAEELAAYYPQVRFIRTRLRQEMATLLEEHLPLARKELVCLRTTEEEVGYEEIRKLWAHCVGKSTSTSKSTRDAERIRIDREHSLSAAGKFSFELARGNFLIVDRRGRAACYYALAQSAGAIQPQERLIRPLLLSDGLDRMGTFAGWA